MNVVSLLFAFVYAFLLIVDYVRLRFGLRCLFTLIAFCCVAVPLFTIVVYAITLFLLPVLRFVYVLHLVELRCRLPHLIPLFVVYV